MIATLIVGASDLLSRRTTYHKVHRGSMTKIAVIGAGNVGRQFARSSRQGNDCPPRRAASRTRQGEDHRSSSRRVVKKGSSPRPTPHALGGSRGHRPRAVKDAALVSTARGNGHQVQIFDRWTRSPARASWHQHQLDRITEIVTTKRPSSYRMHFMNPVR